MEHLILFSKGKLYELVFIVFSSLNSTEDPAVLFFGASEAELKKLGVTATYNFNVQDIEHGDFEASQLLLIEWSSKKAFGKFRSHKDWQQTWPANNTAVELVNTVQFTVPDNTEVHFEEGGLYEFAGFWMNRHNAKLMPQYFEKMGPVVKQAQPQPMLQIQLVTTSSPFDLKPDRFNLLKWNSGAQARTAMFESEEFKSSGYLRALALDRILTVMVEPGQ